MRFDYIIRENGVKFDTYREASDAGRKHTGRYHGVSPVMEDGGKWVLIEATSTRVLIAN